MPNFSPINFTLCPLLLKTEFIVLFLSKFAVGIKENSVNRPQPATPPAAVPDFDAGPVSQPETGKVTETVDSLPLGVAAPTGESAGDAIRLRLHAIQECWISVVSDGRRVAQRTLFPGDVLSLRANERFDVVLGNAGGIGLEINGKPAKTLGKPGEVVRFEITPQSVTSLLEKGLG